MVKSGEGKKKSWRESRRSANPFFPSFISSFLLLFPSSLSFSLYLSLFFSLPVLLLTLFLELWSWKSTKGLLLPLSLSLSLSLSYTHIHIHVFICVCMYIGREIEANGNSVFPSVVLISCSALLLKLQCLYSLCFSYA